MRSTDAIRATGLGKTFRNGRVVALDGVDITVAPGDLVAVTGASGSGKSTLLHALAGLVPLDRGAVEILGQTPRSAADWTRLRRGAVGLVFQDDWLLPTLTAAENVELPMIGTGKTRAQRRKRAEALLERVNAGALRNRQAGELSGGERQRIAVARGLANAPAILLADEPTGELDSANSRAVIELIFALRQTERLTVVIVTHDDGIAAACPRRFVMQDGRGAFDPGEGRETC